MFAKRLLASAPRLSASSVLARGISTRALLAPKTPVASPIVRAFSPARSLHTTRSVLAEGKTLGSIHVLDAPTVTTWQEIPKGGLYKGMTRKEIIWKSASHGIRSNRPSYLLGRIRAAGATCSLRVPWPICHLQSGITTPSRRCTR